MAENKKSEIQSMREALARVASYGDPRELRRQDLAEMYNGAPQEVQESEETDVLEQVVFEFLESFIGDSLNESASEEEQEDAIVEAVANLNNLCALVNGYFDTFEAYDHAVKALTQD